MWLLLKGLALRFVVGRTVGGMLATLMLVLVPLGAVLKVVGLPILFVLAFGALLLMFVGVLLTVGLFAIKILLPIVLIVWFVRWIFGRNKGPVAGPPPPEEPLGPVGG